MVDFNIKTGKAEIVTGRGLSFNADEQRIPGIRRTFIVITSTPARCSCISASLALEPGGPTGRADWEPQQQK